MTQVTQVKRKGARSTKDIPKEILEQLNEGKIETANLVEWLAVDQKKLLENFLNQSNRKAYLKPILNKINLLPKQTVNTINQAIGATLFELSQQQNDEDLIKLMSNHTADLIRCWATYTIGYNEALNIEKTLTLIKPFAADTHFGVREIAWMAVRSKISNNLSASIVLLSHWTTDKDDNVRRFTTEATRPRGVWCEHIDELKKHPEMALVILEPLKSDEAKYVQDSVANWLNDASKSQADFVLSLCERWEKESDTKATKYIIKKALRTLKK